AWQVAGSIRRQARGYAAAAARAAGQALSESLRRKRADGGANAEVVALHERDRAAREANDAPEAVEGLVEDLVEIELARRRCRDLHDQARRGLGADRIHRRGDGPLGGIHLRILPPRVVRRARRSRSRAGSEPTREQPRPGTLRSGAAPWQSR